MASTGTVIHSAIDGEQRDRDGAAFAGLLAGEQRLQHGGVGIHAGADVGRRDADAARRLRRVPVIEASPLSACTSRS